MGRKYTDFPYFVKPCTNGAIIKVEGYLDDFDISELIDKRGYIVGDNIYQYLKYPNHSTSCDKTNPHVSRVKETDGTYFLVIEKSTIGKEIKTNDMFKPSINAVVDVTDESKVYDEEQTFVPTASSTSIFIPDISPKDDFLKKIIKTIFLIKKVATARYRKKMSKSYAFPNLFQSLNGETKTSTVAWQTWIELLGIDAVLIVKDSGGDPDYPINDYIVYSSRNDGLEIVTKDKLNDFLKDKLY